ncbi:MAG: mercury methylation corrinoid protein HgcA [Deltaproteobacteria bacterium]|nr:mercury methylation corrinoid protein HgcA [Deltaproteobacteria bacterium]
MAIAGQAFVIGVLETPVGPVPQVATALTGRDRWGALRVRLGFKRMQYTVEPGLYAVGAPQEDSPVLVTANYKLSFDHLRAALTWQDAWILVLDTNGINVWCAAGKGTFGTAALCAQVAANRLVQLVRHRRLVVPQLGAPGIAAHAVKQQSGFSVVYGPVMARHLPEFLACGMQATQAMRRKTFSLSERAVLVPVEFVIAMKWALPLSVLLYGASGLFGPASFWENVRAHGGGWTMAGLWSGVVAGTVLTPLLLPVLPGRAFSLKGGAAGLMAALVFLSVFFSRSGASGNTLTALAWLLLIPAIASFLGMEFTGASTYTSLSGVKKEMRLAVPLQVAAVLCGLLLLVWARRLQ